MNSLLKRIISALLIIAMLGAVVTFASCDSEDTTADATAPTEPSSEKDEGKSDKDSDALVRVPRAIVNIKKGDKISADDLMICLADGADVPTGAVLDVNALIGKYASRYGRIYDPFENQRNGRKDPRTYRERKIRRDQCREGTE